MAYGSYDEAIRYYSEEISIIFERCRAYEFCNPQHLLVAIRNECQRYVYGKNAGALLQTRLHMGQNGLSGKDNSDLELQAMLGGIRLYEVIGREIYSQYCTVKGVVFKEDVVVESAPESESEQ